VTLKAAFFGALDRKQLTGPDSASVQLQSLLAAEYAAPDLGEMAAKLAGAAEAEAEGVYQAALRREKQTPEVLQGAAALYQLALDHGAPPALQASRGAFLKGAALLADDKPAEAEPLFAEAARLDSSNTEARFRRGLAKYLAGDREGALTVLEAELPGDPRTAVLRLAQALETNPKTAAQEIERYLFDRRFGSPK